MEVLEAIVVSSEALNAVRNTIKKVEKMIARANIILFKTEPVRQTIRLEEMIAESVQIQRLGAEKRTTLVAEIKSRLEKTAFDREELKSQGGAEVTGRSEGRGRKRNM